MKHAVETAPGILHIKQKKISLDKSEVLYRRPFDAQGLQEDFEVTGGHWEARDGWLIGETRRNGAGILYSRASYEGDVLLDFVAEAVPPCSNDCTPQSGRDSGCSAQDNVTGKPSVECKENTESKAFIESSSCRV